MTERPRKHLHFQMFCPNQFFDDIIEKSLVWQDPQVADLAMPIGNTLTVL